MPSGGTKSPSGSGCLPSEWPPAPWRPQKSLVPPNPNLGRGPHGRRQGVNTSEGESSWSKPQRAMEAGDKSVSTLLLAGEALAQSRHSMRAVERHSDGPQVSPGWPAFHSCLAPASRFKADLAHYASFPAAKWEAPSSPCVPLNREDMQGGCQPVPCNSTRV